MLEIQFARYDDTYSLVVAPVEHPDNDIQTLRLDVTGVRSMADCLPDFGVEYWTRLERMQFIEECILYALNEGSDSNFIFTNDEGESVGESQFLIDGEPVTAVQVADYLFNQEYKGAL